MAIEFEKKLNTKFYDDRSTQDIPRDFALKMGLGTCTWDFALHTGKSQVPGPRSHVTHILMDSLGSKFGTLPPS